MIIILICDPQFLYLSELDINSTNSDVNVFVYNFWPLERTAQCDLVIRASSEQTPSERFDNPLNALHSNYSFLAKTHRRHMGNQTDYGQQHADHSGVDKITLTLSKAGLLAQPQLSVAQLLVC